MSLLLCAGTMVKAAPTDLPQMTENPETPVFYTISNTRSTSGKYLYYAGDELGLKDSNTKSVASLFYFTGTTDEMYVHNAATTKKLASVTSWTEEGTAWAINVTPYGDGTTGLSIGPWDDPFGGACWNEFTHNDCYTTWQANDAGSIFTVEIVEDFSIFLTDAKAAAVAELENLQTVSEIYPDATEAIAAVGAVTVESATISAIEAAIATVNQCVADYKATALQALGGKYFAINTPARDNGFMKVAGTQVSGAADASSSAAVWQFECADGVVKVFNPYTGKYLCEPGNNSTMVAVTENVAAAGAYQLVVYADAENDEAKVKLTSNGKSIHMDAAGVLVRWDNGGASEWTVSEIAVDVTAEITALLDANAENHAETPALGQYSTAGYTALQDAQNTVTTLRQVADAVAAFEAAKCLPVFTIDGVWGYALGMSVYESEEGSLLWRETEHTESMLWTFDMTDTIVGVTDKVVVKNLATGNLFWGASFIQVTETSEAVADDGLFLFYTEGTGAPVHAAQAGQTIVRWNNLSAASASAWKFTFAGTTYSINDLPEVPDTPVVPDTPEGVVNDLASADPTKCYTISTNGRGAWAVDTDGTRFSTTGVEEFDVDAADARQQFAFLSANGEDYYLYSVSAKKFVKQDRSLVVGAGDAIEFVDASSFEESRVMVRFRDIANANINIGGDNQMVINSWGIIDAGNAVLIAEAGDFDATEALAQLADPEAAELNALIAQVEALVEANAANHAVEPALGQYSTAAYEALAAAVGADSVSKASLEAAIAAFEAAKCLPVFTIDGVCDYAAGMSIYELDSELHWKATDRTDESMLWTFDMTNTIVGVIDKVVVKNLATGNYFDNAFFVQVTETEEAIADDGLFLIYPEGMGFPLCAWSDGRINRGEMWSVNSPCAWKFTYVGTTYGANTPHRDALDVLLYRAKELRPYSSPELGYYVEDFSYLLEAIAEAEALLLGEPSEAECEAMVAELSQAVEQFESSDKTFRLPESGKAYRIVSAFSAFYELQSVEKAITINASDNTLWWGDLCPDSLQQEFVFEPVLGDSGVHLSWNMDINLGNGTTVSETQYFYNLKHVATGLYASYNDSAKFHLDEQPCTVYLTCLGVGQFGLRFRVENEYGGGTIHCVHTGDHNNGVPSTNQGNYGGVFGISSGIVSWYGGFDTASAWYIRECPARPDTPAPATVTELSAADPTKCYTISTNGRGAWAVDSAGIRFSTTGVEGYTVDVSDPNQQFAILSANGEDYYLYSVSAKKFVKRNCSLVAGVADAIEFVDASSWEEGRVMVRFRDYVNANINIGGSNQIAINSWDIIDAGNAVLISEAGDFDATEALDMLLDSVAPADPDAPVFTEKVDAAMPLEFLPNADGWVEGTEWYDEENSIVGFTSPMYRFEEKVETFRIVVMRSQAKEAFFCLSELAFYDANGVKIELTEANVTSNADHNALNPTNPDGGGIAALFDGDIGTYFHSAWKNFPDEVHYLEVTLPNGGYDAFGFRMLSRAKDGINDQSITFPRRMLITDGDYQRLALEGLLAETGTFNLYPFPEIGYYYDDLGYFHDAISRGQDMVESGASESECGAAIAELMQAFRQYDQNESIRLPEPGKPYRFISAFPGFDENQSVEKAISVDTLQNRLWWETVSGDNQLQEFVLEPVLDSYGNPRSWLFTIHFSNGKKVMETQYYYTMQNVATGLYVNYSTADGFHLTEQPSVVYVTPLGYGQFGIRALLANANGGNSVYCASVGYHNGGIPADSVDYFGGVPGVNSVLGSSYGEKYSPSSWFIREVQELPYAMSVSEEEFKSGFVHFEATDVVTLTADKDCSFADLKFYSPYYYNRNISVEKCELSGNIATITLDRKVTACAFEFDNYEGVSSITFNAEAQVEEPDTVPSLEMIFAYPQSDVPVSRADFVKLLFNKEVTLALPEEGIVVRGATTGAEFTVREGRVIEDMNGWHVLLYFLDEKGAYDAVDVADTYTYTIPAGVIQSADGEEYPETTFTFSIYETFPLISYYPTECSVLETIVLTFDRAVTEVVMPTEGLTVTDIYYTPVAKVKHDVIISEDMKTVTLELESPITTPGWYYLDLYTGVFLDEQGMGNSYESLAFEVYEDTSSDPILGDVNSDGQLTMMDVVMQVNAVLNISQEGYDSSVADMNGDGEISIVDVVAVLRLVLGYEPVAAAREMNREASVVTLEVGDVSIAADGAMMLPIYMNNTAAYTAFQVDVMLPEGMTLSDAVLGERAKSSHSMSWSTLENGATRIVAYAMNNATFRDNDEALMYLTLQPSPMVADDAVLTLVDGRFATVHGGEDHADDAAVMMRSETTSVAQLSGDVRISGADDAIVVETAAAIVVNIYSLTGQQLKSIAVEAGTNTIALPAGVYVVNGKKVIVK